MNAHPNFINFTRSIEPSEGRLFAELDGGLVPIQVMESSIRGSISNHLLPSKPKAAKKDAEEADAKGKEKEKDPGNPNLQRIDVCFLPDGAERLVLTFSLSVNARSLTPEGCNDEAVRSALGRLSAAFAEKGGYVDLARRYVWNLANARTLWRNRNSVDKKAKVTAEGKAYEFDADAIGTFAYDPKWCPAHAEPLVARVADALSGKGAILFLDVEVSGRLAKGAPVYPSQEFIEAKGVDKRTKVLCGTPARWDGESIRHASMHSQKIGNAVRTIDSWHPQADEIGCIAVETYGYSQSALKTVRKPDRKDRDGAQGTGFYDLLVDIDGMISRLADVPGIPDDVAYFMAVLVRGGVFSRAKEKDGEK